MTVRLVAPPSIEAPIVRPSAKVATVAQLLEDDPRQVRRMVARGDLEAHRVGKRGIRVFLDSVEALQRDQALKAQKTPQDAPAPPPRTLTGATRTAHVHAVRDLQRLGLVPASRR